MYQLLIIQPVCLYFPYEIHNKRQLDKTKRIPSADAFVSTADFSLHPASLRRLIFVYLRLLISVLAVPRQSLWSCGQLPLCHTHPLT